MVQIKKGSTDVTRYFHLRSVADGTSKTGLTYESAGAVASYVRTRGARTAITLATLATADAAHSDGGFIEVDGTNAKGLYRLDIPDAAFASGVDEVIVHLGFTGVFEESLSVELVDERAGNLKDDAITATKIGENAIGASELAQGAADLVWSSSARSLTDKAGFSLSTAGILAIWHQALSGIVTADTIGKLIKDYLDATITSRSSHAAADVWSVATRALTDKTGFGIDSIANDTITAASIATNAITSSELAQSAADKIWNTTVRSLTDKAGFTLSSAGITAIWEKDISGYSGVGYAGTYLKALYDDWVNGGRLDMLIDAITADTDELQQLITSGKIAAQVKGWDDINLTALMKGDVKSQVDAALGDNDLDHLLKVTYGSAKPVIGSIFDQIMNKDGNQTYDPTTDSQEAIRDNQAGADAGAIATAVWAKLLVDITTTGSIGKLIKDYLDAAITSRSSHDAAAVWGVATRALTDKVDFGLSATSRLAIWHELLSNIVTESTIGKLLKDYVDAAISTRSSHVAADVWNVVTRALTDKAGFTISGTKTTLDALEDVSAADVWGYGTRDLTDKTGYALSSAGVLAIWHQLLTGIVTDSTVGKLLKDNVDAAISTRSSHVAADVWSVSGRELSTPANYKADVSALALEATLTAIKGGGWTDETLKAIKDDLEAIPTNPTLQTVWTDAKAAYLDAAISSRSSHGASDVATAVWAASSRALSTPNDYKADVTGLAQEATLTAIKGDGWSTETLKAIYDVIGGSEKDWSDAERAQIRDALGVDGSKTTATGGQLQDMSKIGPGGTLRTWTQRDSEEQPMDNVQVWISTDIGGTNIIAGTLLTNASGQVSFMLDDGTYYVWREKAGYNFSDPQTWTVPET